MSGWLRKYGQMGLRPLVAIAVGMVGLLIAPLAGAEVSIRISPASATITPDSWASASFSGFVSGAADIRVGWIVPQGRYVAAGPYGIRWSPPLVEGVYPITVYSQADPAKQATAYVTVRRPSASTIAVSVAPATASLQPGQTQTFAATVTGSNNGNSTPSVSWSIREGTTGGQVTAGGVYTAPAAPGAYHVVATSNADRTRAATAQVNVVQAAPIISSFSASRSPIAAGESTTLTAVFSGGSGSISPNVGPVQSGVPVTVTPAGNAVYTLAVGTGPNTVTRQTTVEVGSAPPPAGNSFFEPFLWRGNHAASIRSGTATTVWWDPNHWDNRVDSGYTATQVGAGEHIDIHKAASADPRDGEEDNSVYAVGGTGQPGVAVMRLDFQAISSARLRNPMLIAPDAPGVVTFYAPKFVTTGHWWEVAVTPANRIVGGELTAVPSTNDPLPDPFGGQVRHPGPGHRPAEDSVNVIAANFSDVPHVTGWFMHFAVKSVVGGVSSNYVNSFRSFSEMLPTDPAEKSLLYHWKLEFYPDRTTVAVDLEGNGQFQNAGSYAVAIPWREVHVHLIGVAYQADHHPQGASFQGQVRDIQWRDVRVSPVTYARTSVAPQDGISQISSRQQGWMAFDLRDTQRFGPAVNGVLQPNAGRYVLYGSMAYTSTYQHGVTAPQAVAEANLQVEVTAEQAAAAAARLVYDIRGTGAATLYVNGTRVGVIPNASTLPGLENSAWGHRGFDFPVDLLREGLNQVRVAFNGAVHMDRLQLEFSHLE